MPTDLVHVQDEDVSLLSLADTPSNVVAQAREVAKSVMALIMRKPKQVIFNGEKYFENDDWVMAGKMYGITVRAGKEPEYVEFGDVKGFKAEAEAYLVSTGQVIGKAYALCLNDEENWGDRPKYEWRDVLDSEGKKIWEEKLIKGKMKKLPKSEKVQVGMVKVPLFQLMSMAQTRASSKVLSMLLKFVPVLAGFRPVPAEEIGNDGSEFSHEQVAQEHSDRPTRAKRKTEASPTEPEKPRDPDCITQEQVTYLYTIASKCKLSHQDVIDELKANFKDKSGNPVDSTRKILIKDYQNVLNAIDPNFHHHAPAPPADEQEEPGANG